VWYGCERAMGPSKRRDDTSGLELNPRRHAYEHHRTVTLPAAVREYLAGRECRYVWSVDPTFAKEAA
jgi:hypothetical protein